MEEKDLNELRKLADEKAEELIKHYTTVISGELTTKLADKIQTVVSPLTATREDYLNDELAKSKVILTEINKSWLGWLLLKRIERKLRKQSESEQ